jgi:hypothetical protein
MSVNELAKLFGRSEATIRLWRRQGIDLNDMDALRVHADRQDARSFGKTRTMAKARRSEEAASADNIPHIPDNLPAPDDKLGAPAALRRLQLAELEVYCNHKTAIASRDMLATSEAEASWIRIAS